MAPTLTKDLKVADECWIALALLHREHPERTSFSAREILERLDHERAHPEHRAGIQVHIYLHNVANLRPNSARYRMFYRLTDGTYRLFHPRDAAHPDRRGKTKPSLHSLPDRYRELLRWYDREYCAPRSRTVASLERDPILSARGLGREIWIDTEADVFVRKLRSGWKVNEASREKGRLRRSNPRERSISTPLLGSKSR